MSLCVASAFAADTAVLQVKGKLTNAACTPQLSNGGVVDYGTIHLGELSATAVNQLGDKDINLTITCGAPTQVGWVVNDDRESSKAGINVDFNGTMQNISYYQYGVGKTTGGVNIGNYMLFIKNKKVTIDGQEGDEIFQTSTGMALNGNQAVRFAATVSPLSVPQPQAQRPLLHLPLRFSHWLPLWLFRGPIRWRLLTIHL